MDFVYDSNSYSEISNLPVTLYDLDQKQNLGKKVEVEYFIKNNINFVSRIIVTN